MDTKSGSPPIRLSVLNSHTSRDQPSQSWRVKGYWHVPMAVEAATLVPLSPLTLCFLRLSLLSEAVVPA